MLHRIMTGWEYYFLGIIFNHPKSISHEVTLPLANICNVFPLSTFDRKVSLDSVLLYHFSRLVFLVEEV